jgi:hypothetical protein
VNAAARIAILRFRTGAVPCAVAARDVRSVRGASEDHTPLWRLLGVTPANTTEDAGWVLGLAHGNASAEVLVQGPIDLAEVSAADLLQRPPALVLANNDLIFGFVRCARELVVLFDIPTLVALAA